MHSFATVLTADTTSCRGDAVVVHEPSLRMGIDPRNRGLKQVVTRIKISVMKSDFAFKETQFYGWESEPKEERPTGFGNSTQWSSEWATVSGEDGADRCGRSARADSTLATLPSSSPVCPGRMSAFSTSDTRLPYRPTT